MADNFQRGGRPAPAPAGGDFFGLAALVFGAGAIIMLVAAIVAMYISSKSEDAVAVEAPAPAAAPLVPAEPVVSDDVAADAEAGAEAAATDVAAPAGAGAEAAAPPAP